MIDANQNHIKGNPFISYPTVPCNTPNDAFSSLDIFSSPSPDPFNNDPFVPLSCQFGPSISTVSPLSSTCESVLPDSLSKGLVGQSSLSGDSASSCQLFNGMIDSQYPQKGINRPLEFPLPEMNGGRPFSRILNQTRVHLPQTPSTLGNGLSNSLLPMVQSPPLYNSEIMPPIVQNGGVMAISPPPSSSKGGRVQRRQKVKFFFF